MSTNRSGFQCLNPLLREERRSKREELLQATKALLDPIVAATRRPKRALRGTQRITERVTPALSKYRMAKHFDVEIEDNRFAYRRRQEAIAAKQRVDCIYVIRTSVPKQELDAPATVAAYKSLYQVERDFRCLKTVDLHVRPIRRYLASRVGSHVLQCMLAYYVTWHLRRAWATLLSGADDPAAAARMRSSQAAKTTRTPGTKRHLGRRQTSDSQPMNSLKGLLRHFAKIARVTNRQKDSGIEIQTRSQTSTHH